MRAGYQRPSANLRDHLRGREGGKEGERERVPSSRKTTFTDENSNRARSNRPTRERRAMTMAERDYRCPESSQSTTSRDSLCPRFTQFTTRRRKYLRVTRSHAPFVEGSNPHGHLHRSHGSVATIASGQLTTWVRTQVSPTVSRACSLHDETRGAATHLPTAPRTRIRGSARRRDATARVHRRKRRRRRTSSSSSSYTTVLVLVEPGARQPAAATSLPTRTLTATAADCRAASSRVEPCRAEPK